MRDRTRAPTRRVLVGRGRRRFAFPPYVPGFTAARDNSDRQTGRAEKRSALRHPPNLIRPPQAARISGLVPLGVRGSRPRMTVNGAPPADNTRRQCSPHNVESQPGQAAGWTMHGRDGVTRALYGAARGQVYRIWPATALFRHPRARPEDRQRHSIAVFRRFGWSGLARP